MSIGSVVADKNPFVHQPSVGVIPLGTGNDLARCLRWGGGYEGESFWKILNVFTFLFLALFAIDLSIIFQKIERSTTTLLDRWSIKITDVVQEVEQQEHVDRRVSEKIPFNIINNYFSIGVVSKTMAKVCILWCLWLAPC